MTGRDDRLPAERDEHAQQAVLEILLEGHPGQRSCDEVVREICEMSERPDEFSVRDSAERAIRDLAAAGLAHRHGLFVFASWPAVRFDELRI
jgi:hypothetical protein